MKRLFILILFYIPISMFAQGHYPHPIQEADSTYEYIYIKGTEADTSEYYIMPPYLTFSIVIYDTTSGGDSSNVKFYVDRCTDPNGLADWTVEDSLNIPATSDSAFTKWVYTEIAKSNEVYYRVRMIGQADNRKLAYTKVYMRASPWNYR